MTYHKVQLRPLTQVINNEKSFLSSLNINLEALQKAIDDTVSRSGVVPNQMEEVLDMNGQRIINVGQAQEPSDVVTKRDIQYLIDKVQDAIANIDNLVIAAKQTIDIYIAEQVTPLVATAVDASIEATSARDTAKTYRDEVIAGLDSLRELAEQTERQAEYIAGVLSDPAFLTVVANIDNLRELVTHMDVFEAILQNMADIKTVSDSLSDILAVSNNLPAIEAVDANKDNINAVSSNLQSVLEVQGNLPIISTVNASLPAIEAVNANKDNITRVANNETRIGLVTDNLEPIRKVSDSIGNIDYVSGHIPDIVKVTEMDDEINNVSAHADQIAEVSAHTLHIDSVANNIMAVRNVSTHVNAVETVGDNIEVVSAVAGQAEGLQRVIDNIEVVEASPENAEKARVWADGDDVEVQALGGTHSSMVASALANAMAQAPEDVPVEDFFTQHGLAIKGGVVKEVTEFPSEFERDVLYVKVEL